MSAFLVSGIDSGGEYRHVSSVKSGKTQLKCPFCKQSLVAKKGNVVEHHFAHHGHSCRDSEVAAALTAIPTIDHLTLLTSAQKKFIERRRRYTDSNMYSFKGKEQAIKQLSVMGVIEVSRMNTEAMDTLLHELTAIDDTLVRDRLLTTKAEAIFAALDTAKDSGAFRGIQSFIESNRVTKTRFTREYNRCQVLNGSTIADLLDQQSFWLKAHVRFVKHYHPHLLPLLKNRLNSYRRQHLYLYEFDDAVKIGMTRYAASKRLKEVESMLGGGAKGKVLAFLPYAGRVERLLHDLFAGERLTIGSHREFYSLEAKDRLTALFAQISNDKKRIASLRYIDKYKNVSDYLMDNDSVRPVAKKYGLSINTIQKLRHCMAIAIGDFDL